MTELTADTFEHIVNTLLQGIFMLIILYGVYKLLKEDHTEGSEE